MGKRRLPTLLTCLVLAACGGEEHEDIKLWMKEASKDMRGRAQPIPEIKPFPVVSYDAGSLLEPFSAAKVIPERKQGSGGVQPDFDRPREPLEAHPLEALRLVGMVRKNKVLHAMIQAGSVVHAVKTGNHLGQNFGVVTAITDSEVRLNELVQDPSGQTADWVERAATLQLQDANDGQREARK